MLIKNVTELDLKKALMAVNGLYGNNVFFDHYENESNVLHNKFRVTLKVHSSRGPGARLLRYALGKTRRSTAACWHVHGTFFKFLPAYAIVEVNGKKFSAAAVWQDFPWNGSMMSKMCKCSGAKELPTRHIIKPRVAQDSGPREFDNWAEKYHWR